MSAETFGYVLWGIIAFYIIASIAVGIATDRALTRLAKVDKDCRFVWMLFP